MKLSGSAADYSIKTKILISLIALPFIMLTFLLVWCLSLFKDDKIAYIFETSSSISNVISAQMSTQLKEAEDQVIRLVEELESNFQWNEKSHKIFDNYKSIDGILVIKSATIESNGNNSNSLPSKLNSMILSSKDTLFLERKKNFVKATLDQNNKFESWLLELNSKNEIIEYDEINELLFFGFQIKPYKIIMILNPKKFISLIKKPGPYTIGLIDSKNRLLISTENLNPEIKDQIPFSYQAVNATKAVKSKDNEEFIISYSSLQGYPLSLAAAIKKSDALEVINTIVKKSLLIFIILLSCSIIIGVFLTEEITSTLSEILMATQKITNGIFNIKVKVRREDEIGVIAKSINLMAIEIKRLLKETEAKVRIEQELKVAQVLQATFFPKEIIQYESCQVIGKFKPASECSGDWWYHMQHKGKVYFFIGDATGHGVSAAFVTSTVFTSIKLLFDTESGPTEIVKKLNEAIHQIYEGKMMMTFLLAEYDPSSRNLKYINASHDPAIVLRKSSEKLKKNEIEHLIENQGPRLGDRDSFTYTSTDLVLNPGDRVFFYTDGIFDIKNKESKAFSERNLYQYLTEAHFNYGNLLDFNESFSQRMQEFEYFASSDDITFFTIEAG